MIQLMCTNPTTSFCAQCARWHSIWPPLHRWAEGRLRSKLAASRESFRERPYHAENTCTRPITDVKQHRARLVVSWETRCEARVSFSFFFLFAFFGRALAGF